MLKRVLASITFSVFRVNRTKGINELIISLGVEVGNAAWIVLLHNDKGPYPNLTSTLSISFTLNLMVAVYAEMLK
jgi:hypothetical protein